MKAVQDCVDLFYLSQDGVKTSGQSIHQRSLQDSPTSWIAERCAARLLV